MVLCLKDFKSTFYQAVRRCYRSGYQNKSTVHILIPESQVNVRKLLILEKEKTII
jgi:hypothetical protein